MWEKYTASTLFRPMALQRRGLSNWRTKMIITAFRYLSAPSKFLPALIALGVNAILFWGVATACSLQSLAAPANDAQVARGKYLVRIAGCNDCHTAGYFFGKPNMNRCRFNRRTE